MTRAELTILGPVAARLRRLRPGAWHSIRYQTQFGPEFPRFPYYPAALGLETVAQHLVHSLETVQKSALYAEWVRIHRYVSITPPTQCSIAMP